MLRFSIITLFFFSIFIIPPQSLAAQNCVAPGNQCDTSRVTTNLPCCAGPSGEQYWCAGAKQGIVPIPGTCKPIVSGGKTTCPDEGTDCTSGTHQCCPISVNGQNKGKPLTCDLGTNKCVVASGGPNGCIRETKPCGNVVNGTFYGDCCQLTNSKGEQLMCADDQGNVVNTLNQKGTCKYITQQSQAPTQVPPATPPCAHTDNQGRCLTISSDFGPFNTIPGPFILKAFGVLLAASGAIAVLLIMRAGYKIMTARGNPEGLQQGREQLIAAIVGLMFLIFSFVLLQVIGVDLLRIPSFQ